MKDWKHDAMQYRDIDRAAQLEAEIPLSPVASVEGSNMDDCNICGKPINAIGAGPTTVGVRKNPNGTMAYTVSHSRCRLAAQPEPQTCDDWRQLSDHP
jgi:hypothetical protein